MQNILNELVGILKDDNRVVADGKLLKNKVVELGNQLDPLLLQKLLSNPSTQKHFFQQVGNVWAFDKVKFQKFVGSKSFLPDSYTSFKNRIGLLANGEYLSDSREVVLAWPFKDCVLEGGQTKEDHAREEVFWNETLAPDEIDRLLWPKVLHNFKRYTKEGAQQPVAFDDRDSFLLKGNNLLVLHTLLKRFEGKVKLVFIDPPYNTGNDSFKYNDRFNHASWLTFMKNRLEVAKRLLHPEGAIFIQIDDKEMAYLKVLCDELFGRENFKECISVKNGSESGVNAINVMRGEQLFKVKEHILYYAKNSSLHRFNPLYVKAISFNQSYRLEIKCVNGEYEVVDAYKQILWQLFGQESLKGLTNEQKHQFYAAFEEHCLEHNQHMYALKTDIQKSGDSFKAFAAANKAKNCVEEFSTSDGRTILVYKGGMLTPLKERIVDENGQRFYGTLVSDFWWDIGATPSSEGNVELKSGKKPEKLLKRIISMATQENDWVLDFFLGSGSTAATALKMKRRFIGIEQMNYGANDSTQRLLNVINGDTTGISRDKDVQWKGGGAFVSAELKSVNEEIVEQIVASTSDAELVALFDKVFHGGFVGYRVKELPFDVLKSGFVQLDLDDKRLFLKEILDKNMLYLPLSEIDDADWGMDAHTKLLNHLFHVPSR